MPHRISYSFTACLALLVALCPLSLHAAIPKAGTVTQVVGTATLTRADVPKDLPVKFRDPVYLKDKITTQEKAFVRVLLGGKAVVTVRELSVLTITEEPDHATIDITRGFVALSVARKRMRPGEYVEIRTPHAIAAVRGTQVNTDVGDTTTFYNLGGGGGYRPN